MLLMAFGCAILVYVVSGFAMAILTSQIMALLQGSEVAARLEEQSKPKVRWYGLQSMMGYHPLNPRVWFDIVRASDLPTHVRDKQRQMQVALAALIFAFLSSGAIIATQS